MNKRLWYAALFALMPGTIVAAGIAAPVAIAVVLYRRWREKNRVTTVTAPKPVVLKVVDGGRN